MLFRPQKLTLAVLKAPSRLWLLPRPGSIAGARYMTSLRKWSIRRGFLLLGFPTHMGPSSFVHVIGFVTDSFDNHVTIYEDEASVSTATAKETEILTNMSVFFGIHDKV